jgi:transposase
MSNVLSEYKVKKIIKCFCEDVDATRTGKLLQINRNTINRYFNIFRLAILWANQPKNIKTSGEFELDESYFGAKRVRGKKGRGAAGKTPVFGLLKRDGKVLVEIVENCSKSQLMPIIQGHILEGSTIHTDGWKAYDGLVLNGYTHYRVFHSHDEFVRGKSHVNGIESFWSYAKRRLAKFNGLTDKYFYLHLKECEWRFNNRQYNTKSLLYFYYKNFISN